MKKYWLLIALPIIIMLLFVPTYAEASVDGALELVESITFDSLEPSDKYYVGMTNTSKMEINPTPEGLLFTKKGSEAMGTDYAIIGVMFDPPVSGNSEYFIEYRYKQSLDGGEVRAVLGPYTMPETISEGVTSIFSGSTIRSALHTQNSGYGTTIAEIIPSSKNQDERLGHIVNPAAKTVNIYKERVKINQRQYYFRHSVVSALTGVRFKISGNIAEGNYFLIEGIDIYRLNRQMFSDDINSLTHGEITKTMPARLDLPTTLSNGTQVVWSDGGGNINLETGEITPPLFGYKKIKLTATGSINGGLMTQIKYFILTLSSSQSSFVSADSVPMANESLENWQVLSSIDGSIVLGENKLAFARSRNGNAVKARKYFVNHNANKRYQLSGENVVVDMTISAENVSSASGIIYDGTDKKITELGITEHGEDYSFFLKYFPDKERTGEALVIYKPYMNGEIINVKLIVNTDSNTVQCFVDGVELSPLGGVAMHTMDDVGNISYIEVSATETLKQGTSKNEFALYDLSFGIEEEEEIKRNQTIVENDYKNFDFSQISSEQLNMVTKKLNLFYSGKMGSDISWLSSNGDALSPKTGEVTRSAANNTVTLTAVFTKGNFHMEKPMEVCILRSSTEGNLALGKTVDTNMLSITPVSTMTDGNFLDGWESAHSSPEKYITVDLGESVPVCSVLLYEMPINGIYSVGKGTVEVSEDNKNWSQVCQFDGVGEMRQLNFDPVFSRYVRLRILDKKVENIGLYEVEIIYNPTDNQIVKADSLRLTLSSDYIVSDNLILPLKGDFGSDIIWTSSAPAVISATGVVEKPQKDTIVTLTATVKSGAIFEKRTFKFFVKGEQQAPSLGGGTKGMLSSGGIATVPVKEETGSEVIPKRQMFADVSEGDWSYEYINELVENNILSGYGTGLFLPKKAVTREEFIKMLIESLKIPLSGSDSFVYEDVLQEEWYEVYVNTATENDITKGISENLFGVGLNITREDMAVMCGRALSAAGKTLEMATDFEINDFDSVSNYAKENVSILVKAGVISGDQQGNFNPKASLTREEAAKIIFKIYE